MPSWGELTEEERQRWILQRARAKGEPIPVRLWTDSQTSTLGYLEFGAPKVDGELVHYDMTFRAAALTEPPRYAVRLHPIEAGGGQ